MRIGLLSFEYPDETGFGGIGTYTWYHARALVRLGHEVDVLAGATETNFRRPEEHDGVRVWRTCGDGLSAWLKTRMSRRRLWWASERVRNALDTRKALRAFAREGRRFDVLEAPDCGAEGAFTSVRDAPMVTRLHSPAQLIMPFYDVRVADKRLSTWLERRTLRRGSALTSSSRRLAEEAKRTMGIDQPIQVILNGIDTAWFDESDQVNVRTAFNLPVDRPLLLFAGRMEHRKGIFVLQDAIRSVLAATNAAVVFAGADPFGYLEQSVLPGLRSVTSRGSVHYVGRLSARQLRSCVRQSDIVMIPSLWESCPYTCLEAMAAGRAIVASDVGGLPELVEDGRSGRIAPSGDAVAFGRTLIHLVADRDERESLGREARARVERLFRDIDTARAAVAVYERVCL